MKNKKINRIKFLEFLLKETSSKKIAQNSLSGKNIYFLMDKKVGDTNLTETFQVEFIAQTKKYFFTILIRGFYKEVEEDLRKKAEDYLRGLALGRNVILDTESKQTLI
jgi:hypothetical protein